jgi:hypothetical protein
MKEMVSSRPRTHLAEEYHSSSSSRSCRGRADVQRKHDGRFPRIEATTFASLSLSLSPSPSPSPSLPLSFPLCLSLSAYVSAIFLADTFVCACLCAAERELLELLGRGVLASSGRVPPGKGETHEIFGIERCGALIYTDALVGIFLLHVGRIEALLLSNGAASRDAKSWVSCGVPCKRAAAFDSVPQEISLVCEGSW